LPAQDRVLGPSTPSLRRADVETYYYFEGRAASPKDSVRRRASEQVGEADLGRSHGQLQRTGRDIVAIPVRRTLGHAVADDAPVDQVDDPVLGYAMRGI